MLYCSQIFYAFVHVVLVRLRVLDAGPGMAIMFVAAIGSWECD